MPESAGTGSFSRVLAACWRRRERGQLSSLVSPFHFPWTNQGPSPPSGAHGEVLHGQPSALCPNTRPRRTPQWRDVRARPRQMADMRRHCAPRRRPYRLDHFTGGAELLRVTPNARTHGFGVRERRRLRGSSDSACTVSWIAPTRAPPLIPSTTPDTNVNKESRLAAELLVPVSAMGLVT
jgi:hypothetical protein